MKLFYLKTFLLCLFALAGTKAMAYDCQVDGIYYSLTEISKTAAVVRRSIYDNHDNPSYSGNVTIPANFKYGGVSYRVTEIGNWAFYDCTNLTSVTIPNSVKRIGDHAFTACRSLSSIVIPNSVTTIEAYAFFGCYGITKMLVDKGNTVYDSRDNCNAIIMTSSNELVCGCKTTVIPNTVRSIGEFAFASCKTLTSIDIPNGVETIKKNAFSDCSGLTKITISNSVLSIEKAAFQKCSGITKMFVDKGNTVYDSRDNCNAIIMTSSNELVSGCKKTIIPNSITSIGDYAFNGCTELTGITLPNNITSIGDYAFDGCI